MGGRKKNCNKMIETERSSSCTKVAQPASKKGDNLALCQNVFLALTLMLGALWILPGGWVWQLQTMVPSGCHPKWLAQSHRKNLISDVPRCHPMNNNSALALSGSIFRFMSNSNIPKIRSIHWRWQEEHRGDIQNKNAVFLWPKFCWFY